MLERVDDNEPAIRGMLKDLATKDMVKELKAELKAEMTELKAELKVEMKETAVETRRHFVVVAEGLRDDVRVLADGVAANTVALQQLAKQVERANERSILTDLRVDDHERRIRTLEHPPSSPSASA